MTEHEAPFLDEEPTRKLRVQLPRRRDPLWRLPAEVARMVVEYVDAPLR